MRVFYVLTVFCLGLKLKAGRLALYLSFSRGQGKGPPLYWLLILARL